MSPAYALLIAMACGLETLSAGCVTIQATKAPARAAGTGREPPCFSVTVDVPDAVQLRLEQPLDLEVVVRRAPDFKAAIVDGFEFGMETVTLTQPGEYRLHVSKAGGNSMAPFTATMTATHLSLHDAEKWVIAEGLSTIAKRSESAEDTRAASAKWEAIGEHAGFSRLQLRLGDLALGSGDLASARSAYETAREACVSLKDNRCLAEATNNSGMVARRMGDSEESQRMLLDAAALWKRLSEPVYQGRTLSNLGLLQWQSGDYQGALRSYSDAARLLEKTDRTAYLRVLGNQGLAYISLAEYRRAGAVLSAAIAGRRRLGRQPISVLRGNLGWAYLREGRLALALSTLERALAEAVQEKNKLAQLPALANLGQVHRRLGRLRDSRSYLVRALEMARAAGDRQFEGVSLYQLGVLSTQEGNNEEARQMLGASLEVRRASGERDAESDTLLALAELEHRAGNNERTREFAEQARTLLESIRVQVSTPSLRASYFSRKRAVFDLLLGLIMTGDAPDRAEESLLLAERIRGRALLELLADESLELAPKPLAEEHARIQRQINFLSARLHRAEEQEEAVRDRVQILLAENDAIEARMRSALEQSGGLAEPLKSVAQLRQSIPADSAFLAYYLGEKQGHLWIVERTGPIRIFPLPARKVIESSVRETAALFDAILGRRRDPGKQAGFEQSLRRLSHVMLGPLRGVRLPERLIFAMDGALHQAPLAALTRPGSSKPLGLTHDLVLAPSAAFLVHRGTHRRRSGFSKTVLVIADPVFSSTDSRVTASPRSSKEPGLHLPRLPFAGEIETLRTLVPSSRIDVLRGFDASPATFDRKRLRDYAVLHLATHTLIDDDEPQMSHIALSLVDQKGSPTGGLLRPQHLSRWELDESLVVLSSCETALGKLVLGEGLSGFTNALFMAGASQMVMSTSKVDAEASSDFFSHFYRRYLKESPGQLERSMREARRAMAASGRWSDPYYWAAFTAVGRLSVER